MASLYTCHLGVLPWMAICFNLVHLLLHTLFEQLINIARYIEIWIVVHAIAYVCVSFNQVEVALHIYFHPLFHTPFNNLYSTHSCLLCKNLGNLFPLVTKYVTFNT